jgi:predicted pyridoxine 5'-phosphate oxidase superfamily flavin-nucleotide-binding protein
VGYHAGSRELQDRFGTRALADRLDAVKLHVAFTDADRAFIETRDMFFLATADEHGQPQCSYKGGDPGFVRVVGERQLAIPNYDGNGMYLSWGNVRVNPQVGLLFIDFSNQRRMRVNGTASINPDDALLGSYPEAQFIVRVTATAIFPNCPRYIHKLELVERSRFVPRAGVETPEPAWKSADWARDVVPEPRGQTPRSGQM